MAASLVGCSVLEDGPCGTMLRPAFCRRSSPLPAGYRGIAVGPAGIRVQPAAGFLAGARAGAAPIVKVDTVSAKARRAANSDPEAGPPGAVPGLLSAGRARTTPIGGLSGRTAPINQGKTVGCAVSGPAQGRVSPHRFMRDNCHYRAQCGALAYGRRRAPGLPPFHPMPFRYGSRTDWHCYFPRRIANDMTADKVECGRHPGGARG